MERFSSLCLIDGADSYFHRMGLLLLDHILEKEHFLEFLKILCLFLYDFSGFSSKI